MYIVDGCLVSWSLDHWTVISVFSFWVLCRLSVRSSNPIYCFVDQLCSPRGQNFDCRVLCICSCCLFDGGSPVPDCLQFNW